MQFRAVADLVAIWNYNIFVRECFDEAKKPPKPGTPKAKVEPKGDALLEDRLRAAQRKAAGADAINQQWQRQSEQETTSAYQGVPMHEELTRQRQQLEADKRRRDENQRRIQQQIEATDDQPEPVMPDVPALVMPNFPIPSARVQPYAPRRLPPAPSYQPSYRTAPSYTAPSYGTYRCRAGESAQRCAHR
jgi:hypothetical protein